MSEDGLVRTATIVYRAKRKGKVLPYVSVPLTTMDVAIQRLVLLVPSEKVAAEEDEEAWIEGAIVRCLVCLGDLGRYLVEFCNGSAALPARYYTLALRYILVSSNLFIRHFQGSTYGRATIFSAGHPCGGRSLLFLLMFCLPACMCACGLSLPERLDRFC